MQRKIIVSLTVLLILLAAFLAYFIQQVIAFTPSTEDEVREWRKFNSYEALGLIAEDIAFFSRENSIHNTGPNLKLSGWLFRQENPQAPTVIALHGKGGNRIGVLRFGKMFHDLGFNVLIYDQRHHGRSEGRFTTYGYYESHDVLAAINFLKEQQINTGTIGIIGESFGAATSLMAAAISPDIKFVIADSSYTDMPNAVKDNAWRMNYVPHYPLPDIGFAVMALIAHFNPWQVSPIESLKNMGKPTLIVHCDRDEWAYPHYAYQLFAAADKTLTKMKMFKDCEHVAAYDDYSEDYQDLVTNFLEKYFPTLLGNPEAENI